MYKCTNVRAYEPANSKGNAACSQHTAVSSKTTATRGPRSRDDLMVRFVSRLEATCSRCGMSGFLGGQRTARATLPFDLLIPKDCASAFKTARGRVSYATQAPLRPRCGVQPGVGTTAHNLSPRHISARQNRATIRVLLVLHVASIAG